MRRKCVLHSQMLLFCVDLLRTCVRNKLSEFQVHSLTRTTHALER